MKIVWCITEGIRNYYTKTWRNYWQREVGNRTSGESLREWLLPENPSPPPHPLLSFPPPPPPSLIQRLPKMISLSKNWPRSLNRHLKISCVLGAAKGVPETGSSKGHILKGEEGVLMCLSAIRRVRVRGLKLKCLQRRGQQLNKVKQLYRIRQHHEVWRLQQLRTPAPSKDINGSMRLVGG